MDQFKISITYSIILLLEDDVRIYSFVKDLHNYFSMHYPSFEIILIANGTEGFYKDEFIQIKNEYSNITIISLYRRNTQAVCMKAAVGESKGDIIIVCGSYQQISIESLGQAVGCIDEHTDMVLPCRKKRVDPAFNQFQSRVFNLLVRKLTGYSFNDLSCTVRVIKREVADHIDFYGNMYRFLPVVAAQRGFNYKEIYADHCAEIGKTGLYSLADYVLRVLDIVSLLFLVRYTKKPFRFFSVIGLFFSCLGIGMISCVIFERIFSDVLIGNNIFLIMGFLSIAVGVQSAGIGLLGEIITFTHGRKRKEYSIDRIISSKHPQKN